MGGEKEETISEKHDTDDITEDAKLLMGDANFDKREFTGKPSGLDQTIRLLKLHGNMKQADRLSVFQDFRSSSSGVLMCTDVAARGLDLPQGDWIVQFTAPICVSDYVHRVGRTARIGAKGSSVIFLLPSEADFVKMLESAKIPLAEMTLEMVLGKLLRSGITGSQRRKPSSMEEAATNLQMRIENAVVNNTDLH